MCKLTAIGDSITHGSAPGTEPFSLVEQNYIKLVSEHFGFDAVENYGMNGTTICTETDWRPTCAMCLYVDEMAPTEYAIIAGGTNDYGKSVEIGNPDDVTEKTFYGALKILYEKAIKKFDKIIIITPIPRKNEKEKNSRGYTLSDYRIAIENQAKKFGLFVIHGENMPLKVEDEQFSSVYIKDGLHPNTPGHKIYADYVISAIEKANFIERKTYNIIKNQQKRLVAIGDSNTHGSAFDEPFNVAKDNFVQMFGKYYGFNDVLNYGINGTTVCPETDWRPTLAMCRYIDEMFPADVAIIAGGANDYVKDVEIGNENDESEQTFYGALNILFRKAKERFNKIIVLTPIPRRNDDEKNRKGYVMDDYRNAIIKQAQKFNLFVVHGEKAPIYNRDKEFCEEYMIDAVHINTKGHKLLFDYMISQIKKASII